ncbi:hypothetical protein BS78_02G119400 [Paspalum vaginatum]|nr:hypothetical protein BS78_02G119400 [Paspalum vaginatum]
MEYVSAAQSLVGNVGHLLGAEYELLSGVGGEVTELRDDLATMNALLRMQSEADEGAVDHFVREWMKQLRELSYDSEDSIDLYKLRIRRRPSENVRAWLQRLLGTLLLRRRLAREIRALRARATSISERHARYYGVNREALRGSAPPALVASGVSSQGALHRGGDDDPEKQQVVAMEEQAETLAEQVKKEASADEERHPKVNSVAEKLKDEVEGGVMGVFSIVGFGGIGKTTLAMEVCRHLEAEFPFQAMVSVSHAFEPTRDLKLLRHRLLRELVAMKRTEESPKDVKEEAGHLDLNIDGLNNNDNELTATLKDRLEHNSCLVVIDDVWTIRAWEAIQSVLPMKSKCNSRIIVTTRIDNVAKACSTGLAGHNIHHMEPLNWRDSKKLFLSRAFGSVDATCPEELEDVMGDILRKCGGLPLAIVSIANILAGYTSSGSKEKWETISKSIGSQMESNPTLEGMRHIVTLSYNHLPYELKNCMMYLSIFPEDYEINKDRLLARWIAEGLVPEKRGLTLMEVAESYLEELVSRNMIDLRHEFREWWTTKRCRVHDVLLEVMVSKSLECNFASLLGGQYAGLSYDRIRRLSIQGDDSRGARPLGRNKQRKKKKQLGHGIEGMDVEHVRSLSMFQLEGNKSTKLLRYLLQKFTLLRVLDLEDCEALTDDHMRYICRLYLLKFLSLKGTKISQVPAEVGELEHLQTLNVRDTNLKGIPETVTKLEKLECLDFSNEKDWNVKWKLPRGLNKMKALRKVADSSLVGDDVVQVAKEVGELQQLEELTLCVGCSDDKVLKELAQSLSKIYALRALGIQSIESASLAFLSDLTTPPRLLRSLGIVGSLGSGRGLPYWVVSLTHLVEFGIKNADLHGDELFDVLCELPNLKSITMLEGCYGDDEIVARKSHKFPVLSNLNVTCGNSIFPKHVVFQPGSMAKLKAIKMVFIDTEKTISGLEYLTSLKEVELKGKKGNPYLEAALLLLKNENSERRTESNQIQVVVKYE